ncbi:TetR/AcrR family transcriptional regulator [Acinetobacter sp. S40]|uniref:TetR/AcrR family transcriptional regulator n=1 Tax=unclassified Acinetobacter TaxID=196816 RepID=UPI00190C0E97|nr:MULTISPECIES: TetR/AcrR family transcriptional regulator [unclassified Acinetobacter]MBJ9985235.1 TetR/AcrR family transcriptional regulator [Acinetobacter sp. S40]MBK0063278.1 TetR/AcrR family transcriptional regulator [Acinetobacter sp. S55]MBK0066810.1 TetR/AcrR family transcriptional regulator [Acinetobacter sp. S54]
MSKKDDIIHTALRLFNANSYNSVGVDRIIQESGVAKMTFYKYFPSKAKLIEECLDQRNINLQESLTASLAACDEHDYLGRIKAIYFWYSAWFHTADFNGCMFQKAVEEVFKIYPSTIRPALEYKEWLTNIILGLLSQLQIKNPVSLTNLLVSILDGMTMQAQIDKNSVKIDEYWARVERLIEFEQKL